MNKSLPERGDIITVDFNPTLGHEQKGLRPALVISNSEFNRRAGVAVICPITSRVRGNLFEVAVTGTKTKGVVLSHQVRAIDLRARRAKICDRLDDFALSEVIRKINLIIN